MESLLGLTLGENARVTGLDWRTGGGLGEGEDKERWEVEEEVGTVWNFYP